MRHIPLTLGLFVNAGNKIFLWQTNMSWITTFILAIRRPRFRMYKPGMSCDWIINSWTIFLALIQASERLGTRGAELEIKIPGSSRSKFYVRNHPLLTGTNVGRVVALTVAISHTAITLFLAHRNNLANRWSVSCRISSITRCLCLRITSRCQSFPSGQSAREV